MASKYDDRDYDEGTLHDCPWCRGTNEDGYGGQCKNPGCRGGQIDDRPDNYYDDDYIEYWREA